MKRTNSPDTYTPGPWVFAYGSVYQGDADTLQDDTAIRIALMDRNEDRTWPTERDNNARLIAAAPELLNACQRLLSRLNAHTADIETCDLPSGTELAIDQAHIAIAKATGTQPRSAAETPAHPPKLRP